MGKGLELPSVHTPTPKRHDRGASELTGASGSRVVAKGPSPGSQQVHPKPCVLKAATRERVTQV